MKRIKFKKILSAFLAITMIMTTFLSTTAFATTETETKAETKVYFEVPEMWGTPSRVYCHLYQVYGGKEITATPWQSKITKCDLADESTNLYSFDTSKLCLEGDTSGYAIEEGADYGLIFSAVNTEGKSYQTCNLTFGSDCLGDTAYVTNVELSGQDDATYNYIAEWKNNSDKYGEMAYITSTGIIIGKYFPVNKPAEESVAEWLHSWAVLNENIITVETVENICTQAGADPQAVYDKYAELYADELADIESYPKVASLERVGVLLGLENIVYVVAGVEELCGVDWVGDPTQAPQNVMTKVGDVYKKTFYDVEPCERIEFKIVEWNYDNSMNWIGDMYDRTIVFANLSEGDVTITYNPETEEISYAGDCVEAIIPPHPYLETIFVAGNGNGNWLNGEEWNPAAESNEMTEIADYVYQITFEDVSAGDNYQFKFAADGSWENNWGGTYEGSDVESDAVYCSDENIVIDVPYDNSEVTITLDLSNFNYATKEGAKFTVEVTDPEPTYKVIVSDDTLILPAEQYTMEKSGNDYVYVFENVEPVSNINLEVLEILPDGSQRFIGNEYGYCIAFDVTEVCDVTVTYNREEDIVRVTGDGVKLKTSLDEITDVIVFGNGDGVWLNDANWDASDDTNKMTEIESGVYQIKYKNMEAFDGYEFLFVTNEDYNWGGKYAGSGVESDLVYSATEKIKFEVPIDNSEVTITLDVRNLDYATRQGAKFTVEVNAMGDVNNDDVLNVEDATLIMKYSVGLIDETALSVDYADRNGDGRVNVLDATAIQKYIAKL